MRACMHSRPCVHVAWCVGVSAVGALWCSVECVHVCAYVGQVVCVCMCAYVCACVFRFINE